MSVCFTHYIKVIYMNFYYVEIIGYCEFGMIFAVNHKISILTDDRLKSMGRELKVYTCIIKY
jgi:hypothetical protein